MLAYNRSIPGPTLKVAQGSEVTVHFTNETDLETTVHWHGLRLDNRFDGVPTGAHQGMMAPVPIGGSFTYRVRFPDPGLYWYHPDMREDYTQELGLYAPIIVVPTDTAYWSPVNREITLTLDDLLLEEGQIAPFSRTLSDHTAMGRFGNVMLVNGETSPQFSAKQGEVVRLYLVNTANVRVFNVRLPGARMKLVGADNGRVEREEFVEEVLLSPSERVIVDVFFEHAGQFSLEHRTPERTYPLATVIVQAQPSEHSFAQEFFILRTSSELEAQRVKITAEAFRQPDKTLAIVAEMPGMEHHGGGHHLEAIEWEDTMEEMNRMSTPHNMFWKLVDRATGAANHDIDWSFTVEDQVKVRIVNAADSDQLMEGHLRIGDSWRKRYDSLVLFTPQAYSALPGLIVPGDPEGYATKDDIAAYLIPGRGAFEIPSTSKSALQEVGFEIVEERQPSFLLGGTLLVTGEIDQTTEFEHGMPGQ